MSDLQELYQQVILEHNKKPRNYGRLSEPCLHGEGFNPLCGDHLWVDVQLSDDHKTISKVTFEGNGCAISRASASMMTTSLTGKGLDEASTLFEQFHSLLIGKLKPDRDPHQLGKLAIFSGIWKYPARVKCAALAWHTVRGALNQQSQVSTEAE